MTDTAQAETPADPESQVQNAAEAFKAFDNPPEQTRDDAGRFAKDDEIQTEAEPEEELDHGEIDEGEVETEEELEGEEPESHPDAVDMPTSWNKNDAETWSTLPPEAQAIIAEREGQRDVAVNQKFQEAANIRKENESLISEANANRDRFLQMAQEVEAAITPQKPNPADYGAGTGQYNREAYDLALAQYEQNVEFLGQVKAEKQAAIEAQEGQEKADHARRMATIQAEFGPKLLEIEPDIADPVKQAPAMMALVNYAVENGIDQETFAPDNQQYVSAAELAILAKAKAYDKLVANKGKPAPKKAGPAIKPGVSSPRSTVRKSAFKKKADRLQKTGSIQDGAAIFKEFMKG